jgi:cytochrome c oxidase subunit IV
MSTLDERPTGIVASTLAAVTGRHERIDPVLPRTGGPAGNAVLTAWTGLVLLLLSVAQLLTLFDVRGLITWHLVIGALLVPPALLKTGTTTWRMLRYYGGDDAYHQTGPPPIVFRVLGPLVVLSTLSLLATGVLLVILGDQTSQHVLFTVPLLRVNWVTLHQVAFFIWAAATGLHLIGRLVPALQIVALRRTRRRVPGRGRRLTLSGAVLVLAVPLALLLAHNTGDWGHRGPRFHPGGQLAPRHP